MCIFKIVKGKDESCLNELLEKRFNKLRCLLFSCKIKASSSDAKKKNTGRPTESVPAAAQSSVTPAESSLHHEVAQRRNSYLLLHHSHTCTDDVENTQRL